MRLQRVRLVSDSVRCMSATPSVLISTVSTSTFSCTPLLVRLLCKYKWWQFCCVHLTCSTWKEHNTGKLFQLGNKVFFFLVTSCSFYSNTNLIVWKLAVLQFFVTFQNWDFSNKQKTYAPCCSLCNYFLPSDLQKRITECIIFINQSVKESFR